MKNNSLQIFVIGGWKVSKKEGEKKKEQEKRGKREAGREKTEAHAPSAISGPTSLLECPVEVTQVFPPALPRNHGSAATYREAHVPQSRCR